ncbi:hypothetical protein GJAV_G00152290 [Gymnothorax javanicus]|nr:hypothetical protein GJAV_G00152290 [Gymnothorax javanicus]
MGTVSGDIRRLLEDCELFVSEILQDENLSRHAQEMRELLLKNFRVVRSRNPQEFPYREPRQEDSSDDNRSSSLGRSAHSDDVSVASDFQDDGPPEFFEQIQVVAAQELSNILKQGYLEKKRRDHSFFGSEWQKRWCVLSNMIFYYFGSEKDKQQKGSFYIHGYSAAMVNHLRKDSKKNACFELTAPGRRPYQFTASSQQEAREWVDQINFILKDMSSSFIPFDDDEEEEVGEEEEEETYDDIDPAAGPQPPRGTFASPPGPTRGPISQGSREERGSSKGAGEQNEEDDDIYEVLPDEDFTESTEDLSEKSSKPAGSTDYASIYQGLWDCNADEPDELSFHRGDLIHVISKEYNIHGWWVGELNGSIGIVPKDFLQPAYVL